MSSLASTCCKGRASKATCTRGATARPCAVRTAQPMSSGASKHTMDVTYIIPPSGAAALAYFDAEGAHAPRVTLTEEQQAQHRAELWRKLREKTSDYHGSGKYQSHIADRLATEAAAAKQ